MLHSLIYPLDPEYATRLTNIPASTSLTTSPSPCTIAVSTTTSTEKENPDSVVDIIRKVASLSLGSQDDPFRDDHGPENENSSFFGKSSGAMLVRTVASLKKQYSNDFSTTRGIMENGRLVCWKRLPWEKDLKTRINKRSFPPLDLITKLASAYFEHVNLFYPLLHRPTFDRAVENGLYLYDDGFGSVLFLVCAVGSQYTEILDERTLSEGTDSYSQQDGSAVFLLGGYAPQAVWNLTAFGIHLAQDVGANVTRTSGKTDC
ncbi:hypothetical protein BDQ17DRAFT_1433625 [Cyathus striatus]|nr:hypothetical protein BDQ17DRAFT_1433625 [Cyathus striatus]